MNDEPYICDHDTRKWPQKHRVSIHEGQEATRPMTPQEYRNLE
jgi:hypothetical protein